MSKRYRVPFLGVWMFLSFSSVANAHPLDLGYLQARVDGDRVDISIELNPKAAEKFSSGRLDQIFQSTLGRSRIFADRIPCDWHAPHSEQINDQQIRVTGEAICPNARFRELRLNLAFLKGAMPTYQVLGRVRFPNQERSFIAQPSSHEIRLTRSAAPFELMKFIRMGIDHIGASPTAWRGPSGLHFPDGIDHILFLLALVFAGGGFWRILKTATGFTLGHSVTLALASLGIVRLPSKLIESAIALSIVYVACEAFLNSRSENASKGYWKIAAAFGFIHGFGFATALENLHLNLHQMLGALLGFNLGVEFGQALIILLVLPILILLQSFLREKRIYYRWVIRVSTSAIALAGSYWFLTRAFG